jgi:hypothetical protein
MTGLDPAPCRLGSRRRRLWWRRLLILTVTLSGLYLARAPLLRGVAGLLIAEDAGTANYLLILDGESRHQVAANWYLGGHDRHILVIGTHPGRLQALGLVPARAETDRLALRARGVPDADVLTLHAEARDDWDGVRALGAWLRERPGAEVILACDRFSSRRLRLLCGRVLGADAGRVHVLGLRHRDYDEADWWRHKEGQLNLLDQGLRLTYAWLAGERTAPYSDWDPDAYEGRLR